jgi:multidrug transporter EmrE-like cation transporter
MTFKLFMIALISILLNSLAQVGLRKSMLLVELNVGNLLEIFSSVSSVLTNGWFIASMTCYFFSIGLWMIVLNKTEVSLAYPMLSMGYVIVAAIGYFYLNESVSILRYCGIATICVGIVMVSRS